MAASGRGWIVKPVTCGLPAALRSVQCGFGPVQPVQGALSSWAHKCSVSRAPLYWFSNSGEVSHFCPVKTSNNDKPCHPFHGHSLPLNLKDLVRLKGRGSILNPWGCESCHVLFPVAKQTVTGIPCWEQGWDVRTAQLCPCADSPVLWDSKMHISAVLDPGAPWADPQVQARHHQCEDSSRSPRGEAEGRDPLLERTDPSWAIFERKYRRNSTAGNRELQRGNRWAGVKQSQNRNIRN